MILVLVRLDWIQLSELRRLVFMNILLRQRAIYLKGTRSIGRRMRYFLKRLGVRITEALTRRGKIRGDTCLQVICNIFQVLTPIQTASACCLHTERNWKLR